jgi:hypothetical protein
MHCYCTEEATFCLTTRNQNQQTKLRSWLRGCDAMWSCRWLPMFQKECVTLTFRALRFWYPPTRPHDVINQKTKQTSFDTVRTSNIIIKQLQQNLIPTENLNTGSQEKHQHYPWGSEYSAKINTLVENSTLYKLAKTLIKRFPNVMDNTKVSKCSAISEHFLQNKILNSGKQDS